MKLNLLVAGLATVSLSTSIFAQSAVRDEFPTGKNRGVRFEHFTKEQWESSNFATPEVMKTWQDRRYGMFIHFGITSRAERDLSWGSIAQRYAPDSPSIMANGQKRTEEWTTWPKDMKLEKFNAREWVEIARRAGFKYIVVCTKHHEGFHMWDTAFSDFKITNTPFGRDYIKELVDACHEAKMPVGFYFAQREWYHPDYQPVDLNNPGHPGPRHAKYLEYMKNAIRELCTKYGKIDIWWWDAVTWNGMFNKAMWDSENVTCMIRELQPGIAINNRASLPGDFDTPEGHLGAFQDWRPWESCIPLSDAWCYDGSPANSFEHVMHLIAGAACGNGNLLLSWGPRWSGAFDGAQTQRLLEIGDWLKINGESIYGTRGGPWKPTGWGGSTRNGKTAYIHLFQRTNGDLVLPAIPGRQVVSAKMLAGGEAVPFKQSASRVALSIPGQGAVRGDLVVALTMNESLDGLPSIAADAPDGCSFAIDSATYGTVISRQAKVKASSTSQWMPADGGATLVAENQPNSFAFHTGDEAAPCVEIDLGKEVKVTGVFIRNANPENSMNRMATLCASVSVDGKEWAEVWKAGSSEKTWEFQVTSFVSGAQIPGRPVRFIRLQTHPAAPAPLLLKQVEVYGKEITPLVAVPEAPAQYAARMQWWREARFGMFIHWDMSSVAGTEISWSRGATKPLDIYGHPAGYVADPHYDNLYKQFNPVKFDARAWVRTAKDAGMKYIVFTAKHHGGFCMWDTKLTDYSIMHTPFKRDVVKELADACHEAGLKFGLYYSQRDWHHPDYGIGDNQKYIDYMNGQVRELLTNYGKVDIMWWDSYGRGDLVKFWRIGETYSLVKSLQPDIVMNNRMAVLAEYDRQPKPYGGDFGSPEQRVGGFQTDRNWESCMCLSPHPAGGWSYHPDARAQSYAACMRTLISCAIGDGNLLLDVAPNAEGVIPADQVERVTQMGQWLAKYGASVYGTTGGPWKPTSWGGSTHKGNTAYIHLFVRPSGDLVLPSIPGRQVVSARLLGSSEDVPFKQSSTRLMLSVPGKDPVVDDFVVALTMDGTLEGVTARSVELK